MTNFNSFPHVFKGKNRITGYIFGRSDKDNNTDYYIFQEFDDENDRKISDMEQRPIYDRVGMSKEDRNARQNQKRTLKLEISSTHYNSWITTTGKAIQSVSSKSKSKKRDVHGRGNNYIKAHDPYHCHKNDSKIVGIMINHKDFADQLWIREKSEIVELTEGETLKQFNTGKSCLSYKKPEMIVFCETVIKHIDEKMFDTLDLYKIADIMIVHLKNIKLIVKNYDNMVKSYKDKSLMPERMYRIIKKIKDGLGKNRLFGLCSILITCLKILQLSEEHKKQIDRTYIVQNWFKTIEQEVDKSGIPTGRFLNTC